MTATLDEARAGVISALEGCGVVAVIRMRDSRRIRSVVDALLKGGVRAIEVTMTVPDALAVIGELAAALPEAVLLGAGTVLDSDVARRVIDSGARFVVSPVFRSDIVIAAHRGGAAAAPGCFSPTEMLAAHDAGADLVKVFPATALGPGFIRDVRGPLPQLRLMPTGGVTIENAGDWIRAGAAVLGIGSALVDAAAIEAGRFEAITGNAQRLLANVVAARQGR